MEHETIRTPAAARFSRAVLLLPVLLLAVACGADAPQEDDVEAPPPAAEEAVRAEVLAEARPETLPEGDLVWAAYELPPGTGEERITHPHSAFLYAVQGTPVVTIAGQEVEIAEGEAVYVPPEFDHTLAGEGRLWKIVLTTADAGIPEALGEAREVFTSSVVEGIPTERVMLRVMRAQLSPRGQTPVHTHPGPEFVYVMEGIIEYETVPEGTRLLRRDDHELLPPDTPVQKRNQTGEMASLLALYLVDPDRPFTAETNFGAAAGPP